MLATPPPALVEQRRQPWLAPLLVIWLCAVTLALTIEALEDATLAGDVAISHAVQRVNAPGLGSLVRASNAIGGGAGMLILTLGVAVTLTWRRRLADALLMLLTLLAHPANSLLKALVASPRPPPDLVRITDPSNGFGFPSGHTTGTVVFCATVAYLAWRRVQRRALRLAIISGASLLALAVGFSRIYSGAHWPSDVLGGYLWGALFTVALVAGWQRVHGWLLRERAVRTA